MDAESWGVQMKCILADVNILKHFELLCALFESKSRRELWHLLQLACPTFLDLELAAESSDLTVWQKCQDHKLVLLTANRNDDGPDSLETTIRTLNAADKLPVITLANADRILKDKVYGGIVADRTLELLFDMVLYHGCGRLYVP